MQRSIYLEFVNQYYDIHDRHTREYLLSLNESEQNQVLASLANKLYKAIVKKVADIDYGQIPNSKGNIANIPNYQDIVDCLTTIRDIIVERHQSTATIDIIFTAIDNMKKHRKIWESGFNLDSQMITIFYNTIALSIVTATNTYISAAIEFVKNPESGNIDIELSRVVRIKTRDGLLFKNLEKFNTACAKGEIEKTFNQIVKAQREVRENGNIVTESISGILLSATVVISLMGCIIPVLHQLTTMLFNLRQKVSDYLAYEADMVRLNAMRVKYINSKSESEKAEIARKQLKIADTLKRWSDKFAIKVKKAEYDSERDIDKDNNEKEKVEDKVPDDTSVLF